MKQQEYSDLFNVYCARDKNNNLFWYNKKPFNDIEDEEWYRHIDIQDSIYGRVPPSVEPKPGDWTESLTCPRWIPKEMEAVALYETGGIYFVVKPFNKNVYGNICDHSGWGNIAKYSGQLDLRVETIRNEQHYKKDGKLIGD
ncbi:MAG: hypothetical protein ACM31M_09645 [Nitrososphaerota archaeon]